MNNYALASITLAITASSLTAAGDEWMIDFAAAKEKATKENKSLLVDFTGSDWCGWCVKLDDEVFSQDVFLNGVAEKFVLVEIDYPQDTSKLSEATQKQNAELQEKYQIQQFPTILLMDAQGRPFAQTSYQANGPDNYVIHLNELLKDGEAIKTALNSASKLEGIKKAEAYIEALSLVPETQLSHYQDITDQIPTLDPEDTTGFAAKKKLQNELNNLETEIDTLFNSAKSAEAPALIDKFIAEHTLDSKQLQGLEIMQLQINMVIADQAGNTDLALKHVDDYVSSKNLNNEEKQEILSMKVGPLIRAGKFEAVTKLTDDIIAIAPDSEVAKMASLFKTQQLPEIIKQSKAADSNESSDSNHGAE